jgi:ethanolamine phosphate transferase 2 subunit G
LQILGIVKASFSNVDFDDVADLSGCERSSSDAERLSCSWKRALNLASAFKAGEVTEAKPILNALYEWCKEAQQVMSGAASNYDIPRMMLGIAVQAVSFGLSLSYMLSVADVNTLDLASSLVLVASYGGMMFASSYVEEEQHFWYWIGAAWLYFISARTYQTSESSPRPSTALSTFAIHLANWTLAVCHRVITRWNQTGQKHAGAPDIVTSVFNPHPFYMWCIIGATYFAITLNAGYHLGRSLGMGSITGPLIGFVISLGVTVPSALIKVAFTASDAPELFWWLQGEQVLELQSLPLILLARAVFSGIVILLITAYLFKPASSSSPQKRRDIFLATAHALFIVLLLTQSRSTNTPMFLLSLFQYWALRYLNLSPSQLSVTCLVLGQVSFFALGNSNAISSIDLSNAYNGIAGYNIVAVGVLLFIGNWAGPLFWSLGVLALSSSNTDGRKDGAAKDGRWRKERKGDAFWQHASIQTLFFTGATLAVMLACTAMRTHLFVWSVFSPKYLFVMAWAVGFHLLGTMGVGRGAWSLAG